LHTGLAIRTPRSRLARETLGTILSRGTGLTRGTLLTRLAVSALPAVQTRSSRSTLLTFKTWLARLAVNAVLTPRSFVAWWAPETLRAVLTWGTRQTLDTLRTLATALTVHTPRALATLKTLDAGDAAAAISAVSAVVNIFAANAVGARATGLTMETPFTGFTRETILSVHASGADHTLAPALTLEHSRQGAVTVADLIGLVDVLRPLHDAGLAVDLAAGGGVGVLAAVAGTGHVVGADHLQRLPGVVVHA